MSLFYGPARPGVPLARAASWRRRDPVHLRPLGHAARGLNPIPLEDAPMSVATDWYRTFFRGVAVDLWLRCTTDDQTRAEADFLEKALSPPPGTRILDVPCGGGRHALALAARGYKVTAVDLSADFLANARADGERRGLQVDWREG